MNAASGNSALGARKVALRPVVDSQTRILILGSLPGDQSLAAARYYANPRNRFWHLLGDVIGRSDLPQLNYDARLDVLRAHHIGLWDAVASAERAGSLDSAIRRAQPAALAELIAGLPRLFAVAFNGQASARVARPLLAGAALTLIDLPSSSPAHAAMPFAQKREIWLGMRQFFTRPDAPCLPCAVNGGIAKP